MSAGSLVAASPASPLPMTLASPSSEPSPCASGGVLACAFMHVFDGIIVPFLGQMGLLGAGQYLHICKQGSICAHESADRHIVSLNYYACMHL